MGCESQEEKKAKKDLAVSSFSEKVVKLDLIDPTSAEFTNQKGFCGEVNSKNRMGGYVGKVRYIVIDPKTVLFENENNIANQQFAIAWSEVCNKEPEFNEKGELIPPKFKVPEPKYKKAEYSFSDKHATATPSSLTFGENFKYIYPILRIGCEDGGTTVTLWSQRNLSHENDGYVAVETNKTKELRLIKVNSREDWQEFGVNQELNKLIKSSDKLKIFFKASGGDLSLQEYDLIKLKEGMRQQQNDCGWENF